MLIVWGMPCAWTNCTGNPCGCPCGCPFATKQKLSCCVANRAATRAARTIKLNNYYLLFANCFYLYNLFIYSVFLFFALWQNRKRLCVVVFDEFFLFYKITNYVSNK